VKVFGCRPPASAFAAPSVIGRHPKPFTKSAPSRTRCDVRRESAMRCKVDLAGDHRPLSVYDYTSVGIPLKKTFDIFPIGIFTGTVLSTGVPPEALSAERDAVSQAWEDVPTWHDPQQSSGAWCAAWLRWSAGRLHSLG
jgi:hypothetical protein